MIDHSSPTSCITFSQNIHYTGCVNPPSESDQVQRIVDSVNADSSPTVPDYWEY